MTPNTKPDYTARFETVATLYYRAFGRLRPGKSEPLATNRSSDDPENRAQFDEWAATRLFGEALDEIDRLNRALADADEELEQYR